MDRASDNCEGERYAPRRLTLQWHVTERCNYRCAHCYQDGYGGEELPFPDLLRVLEQFKELVGSWGDAGRGHLTVTGGEPFVRRDFLELLEVVSAQRRYFSFAILTNGSLIDRALARRLRVLGPAFVQVSVEGARETHERIRGRGSFEKAASALRCLAREGIPTFISFTAHRGNFQEFPQVVQLGRRLGVTRVWADRLVPWGMGQALGEQVLAPGETKEFFEIMARARAEAARSWFGRTEVAMRRALQFLVAGGRPYRCAAGDSLVTVMPNGDLYPCRRMPIRVGNLLETPLKDLYYQSELFRALRRRDLVGEGCAGCFYRNLCAGGLRCLSYALTGDPFQADPGCWRRQPEARPAS